MPWLRNLPSLKPSTPPPPHHEDLTVSHLMNPDLISWDHNIVQSLFNHVDATTILTTPLYNRPTEDSRIWKATTDGSYTVKSAYRICIDLIHEADHLQNNSPWMLLWNLKIPPRIRSFLWRLAHQCLPIRSNLTRRGIPCDDTCVSCDLLAETHMHTFFVCSKAVECWDRIGIGNIIRELLQGANDFTVMLFDLFGRLHDQKQLQTAMTLWSLWKSREKLWESTDTPPITIVTRAHDVLQEWSCVQKTKSPERNSDNNSSWAKPPTGMIKCNVDDATFNDNSIVGYGMCFRDSAGQLLFGKSDYLKFSASVLEAESLGLLQAIKMAISNDIHGVIFESESKSLVNALNTSNTPVNEFGDLVIECKSLLLTNPDFVVPFVRRQANKVAHSIARAALSHPSPYIFHDVSPTLYPLIMNEMQ